MYYIGIDLGGTNIAAGLVDGDGKIICKGSVPTLRGRPDVEIIRDMAMLAKKVANDAGVDIKDVKSIGIGVPGTANNEKGVVVFADNIYFHNTPIREIMQTYINLPVIIDNDANCAALAESIAGAAKDVDNFVAITLGTGVGGGIVINKKLYKGFNYAAAEMGHMVVVIDGEQCNCGRKGCWETYASATALIRQTRKAAEENPGSLINRLVGGDLSKIDAKTAFDAAKQGDETGLKVVDQYISYIAAGLVSIINILTPEVVLIGGGVSKEGEYLLKPLREKVKKEVYFKDNPQTQIRTALLGNDAGIIGAAMLGKYA